MKFAGQHEERLAVDKQLLHRMVLANLGNGAVWAAAWDAATRSSGIGSIEYFIVGLASLAGSLSHKSAPGSITPPGVILSSLGDGDPTGRSDWSVRLR